MAYHFKTVLSGWLVGAATFGSVGLVAANPVPSRAGGLALYHALKADVYAHYRVALAKAMGPTALAAAQLGAAKSDAALARLLPRRLGATAAAKLFTLGPGGRVSPLWRQIPALLGRLSHWFVKARVRRVSFGARHSRVISVVGGHIAKQKMLVEPTPSGPLAIRWVTISDRGIASFQCFRYHLPQGTAVWPPRTLIISSPLMAGRINNISKLWRRAKEYHFHAMERKLLAMIPAQGSAPPAFYYGVGLSLLFRSLRLQQRQQVPAFYRAMMATSGATFLSIRSDRQLRAAWRLSGLPRRDLVAMNQLLGDVWIAHALGQPFCGLSNIAFGCVRLHGAADRFDLFTHRMILESLANRILRHRRPFPTSLPAVRRRSLSALACLWRLPNTPLQQAAARLFPVARQAIILSFINVAAWHDRLVGPARSAAIRMVRAALHAEPKSRLIRLWAATDYLRLGDRGRATNLFRSELVTAHASNSYRASATFWLGVIALRGGHARRAATLFWTAATSGNALAMCRLGVLYHNGDGVPQDYSKAMAWYRKGAAAGSGTAMNNIGVLYQGGQGVPKSYAKAMAWYRKGAAAGSGTAMNNIGVLYALGHGVPQDYAKAMAWYRKAAAAGCALAMANIGAMYFHGWGVQRSFARAKVWLEKAAAAGNGSAMKGIGMLYENGLGVPQNYAKAMAWYREASKHGSAPAMYRLGWMYASGLGAARDYRKALSWFEKSSARGDAKAMYALGSLYSYGGHGVEPNLTKAFGWFKRAAKAGLPDAEYALGSCYEYGTGTAKNLSAALSWYRKAAAAGVTSAAAYVGSMYQYGRGVHRDYRKARRWFRLAASRGDAAAMYALGVLYSLGGHGVEPNQTKAFGWFKRAARAGLPDAEYALGLRYEHGTGTAKNLSAALSWYHKAATAGQSWAMARIGRFYLKGIGVKRSHAKALAWYRKAAAAGYTPAMTEIGVMYFHGWGVPKSTANARAWFKKAAAAGNQKAKQALEEMKVLASLQGKGK